MARKPVTLSEAAGTPPRYPFPGLIAGRKLTFEGFTIRALRLQQEALAEDDVMARSQKLVEMTFGLLTGPKVRVTEGEPFDRDTLEDELSYDDVTVLWRFFNSPQSTYAELTAKADETGEDDDPKAD